MRFRLSIFATVVLISAFSFAQTLIRNPANTGWEAVGTNASNARMPVTVYQQTPIPVSGTFWQTTQPVSATTPLLVSGTFWQATQPVSASTPLPVSGTFWQATQPVSATTPLPVSGTVAVSSIATPVPATQSGTWTVQPGNTANTTAWLVTDSIYSSAGFVKAVDFTASQTAQTLWTPTSGKKFVITDVELSCSAAGAITMFDATDATASRVSKINCAANGGMVHAYRKPYVSAAANNVLKYTTGSGVAGSLIVTGYEQ